MNPLQSIVTQGQGREEWRPSTERMGRSLYLARILVIHTGRLSLLCYFIIQWHSLHYFIAIPMLHTPEFLTLVQQPSSSEVNQWKNV